MIGYLLCDSRLTTSPSFLTLISCSNLIKLDKNVTMLQTAVVAKTETEDLKTNTYRD